MASDKTEFSAGQSAVLTATTDADIAPSASTIQIVDQTTGSTLKSCTSGTSCAVTTTFLAGAEHRYLATVRGLSSNEVVLFRSAWTVSLTVNKPEFIKGESVTFSASANQNVGSTGGNYRLAIYDKTTGSRLTSCSTGSACSITTSSLFDTGNAHTYEAAVVGSSGGSTYSTISSKQASSTEVQLARKPWVVTLTTNKAVFAVGDTVQFVATTNQTVPSYGPYRVLIFDVTAGSLAHYCSQNESASCSFTTAAPFPSGGAHTYVAQVVARASPTTYGSTSDLQATSNPVQLTRQAWSLSLTANRTSFKVGETVTLTALANQPMPSGSEYKIFIFDTSTGLPVGSCQQNGTSQCSSNVSFTSGGPRTYIAQVAKRSSTGSYGSATDVQSSSNAIEVSRAPWSVLLSGDKTVFVAGELVNVVATPNQSLTQSGYSIYIYNKATGRIETRCSDSTSTEAP